MTRRARPHAENTLLSVEGGPGGVQVNQNTQLYDAARAAFGQPRNAELSLKLPDAVVPVVALDPDSPPIIQYKGQHHFTVAAAAGFRSEIVVATGVGGPPGSVIRAVIYVLANGINAYQSFGGSTISGYILETAPAFDSRLVGNGAAWPTSFAPVFIGIKNTAAANLTGRNLGNTAIYPGGALVPFGPFYLAPQSAVLVSPTADNAAIAGWIDWQYFSGGKGA